MTFANLLMYSAVIPSSSKKKENAGLTTGGTTGGFSYQGRQGAESLADIFGNESITVK